MGSLLFLIRELDHGILVTNSRLNVGILSGVSDCVKLEVGGCDSHLQNRHHDVQGPVDSHCGHKQWDSVCLGVATPKSRSKVKT